MLPVSVLCGCSAVDSRRIKYTETVVEKARVPPLCPGARVGVGVWARFGDPAPTGSLGASDGTPSSPLRAVTAPLRGQDGPRASSWFFFQSWFHSSADLFNRINPGFFSFSLCQVPLQHWNRPILVPRSLAALARHRRCRRRCHQHFAWHLFPLK